MPRNWTPEARAEFGRKMQQAKRDRKANAIEDAAVANPVSDEVIPDPPAKPRRRRSKSSTPAPSPVATPTPFSVASLVTTLESLPIAAISYPDCGLLINALNAATTALALARRQKQEQLDAGTHRAPCSTCSRMIDISKAGGFQILTERDEFYQPKNVYYCSQQCVLAKNMPSHAKQEKKSKTGANV